MDRFTFYEWTLWQTLVAAPVDIRLLGFRGRLAVRRLRKRRMALVDREGWVRRVP